MEWKRTKLVIHVWDSVGFRVTELHEGPKRYKLESRRDPDSPAEFYSTLDEAKGAADLKNRLALLDEDNARLRRELDELRQGNAFERQAAEAKGAAEPIEEVEPAVVAEHGFDEIPFGHDDDTDDTTPTPEFDPWFDTVPPDCGKDGRGVPRKMATAG